VEEFAGQPIAALGMNTAKSEKDARFMVEKMRAEQRLAP
jgi:hypothetical protein